jgi:hypothetical protein
LLAAAPPAWAQQFQTMNGAPVQMQPYVSEPGAPQVTVTAGTPIFAGLDSTGTDSGTTSGDTSGTTTGTGDPGGSLSSAPATTGATSATGNGSSVTYTNPDGTTTTLSGGSLAWRNNNPGNIIYGPFAQSQGAVGSNNGFAVFPDAATGNTALNNLLNTQTYQNLSVNGAIARYAPAFENNTAAYQSFVTNTLGVSGTTSMSSLSSTQMQALEGAIRQQEGYIPGTVITH